MKRYLLTWVILTSSMIAFAQSQLFKRPDLVKPFRVEIQKEKIDSIFTKLKNARLPKQMPPASGNGNWQSGADYSVVESLRKYWLEDYSWNKAQESLNRFPQFKANVDGQTIHFYYVKGEGKNPTPLLLSHGWPGSVVEFLDVIEPLTNPTKFGGKPEDAFTVIIPSLPGYGFSSLPEKPINAITTAALYNKLMTEIIGYDKYLAQGGDLGAFVVTRLAYDFPQHVKAINLNMFIWGPANGSLKAPLSQAEIKWVKDGEIAGQRDFNYGRIQMTEPMVLSAALNDSPLGTATWILQKFYLWSDNNGDIFSAINRDKAITDIMLYLLSEDGISGSFWFYRGMITELKDKYHPGYVKVPTSYMSFPKEFVNTPLPESVVKRQYNLYRFTEMAKGGHFGAMEQPEMYVKELREAFKAYH